MRRDQRLWRQLGALPAACSFRVSGLDYEGGDALVAASPRRGFALFRRPLSNIFCKNIFRAGSTVRWLQVVVFGVHKAAQKKFQKGVLQMRARRVMRVA